jgi:MFS transporter, PHS family, inorganic phosphate transporter
MSMINPRLYNNGVGNLILSAAGLIPGYWVSVATIDTIGRKPIQVGGFVVLTILFCIIGFGFHKIPTGGLFALYCLCNFFQNFGPNTTTFIVPGEVFPTRYRSTGHGISAATGKIGSIIAQALIGPLRNKGGPNAWLNHVMEIFALFMYIPFFFYVTIRFCGIFTSLLIPETKRKRLEELTGEDHWITSESTGTGANRAESGSEDEKVV